MHEQKRIFLEIFYLMMGMFCFFCVLGAFFFANIQKKSDMNTVFTRKNDISSKKLAYFDGFDRFFVPLGP